MRQHPFPFRSGAVRLLLLICGALCVTLSGCEVESNAQQATEPAPGFTPSLRSVFFGGAGQQEVELDGYGTCTQAHWVTPGVAGGIAGPNPYVSPAVPSYYNAHGAPVAYVRGSTPTLTARFSAPEDAQEQVEVVGRVHAAFDVGAAEPVVYEAEVSGTATFFNGEWVASDLRCDQGLPDDVGLSEAFTVTWTVTAADGVAREAGASSVAVYLLRQAPREGLPLLHTPVDLACRAAAGLDDDRQIIDAVWRPFAQMHVTRARDGQPLSYYGTYHSTAGDLRGLLVAGSGQCTTWAYLMHVALGAHGIDSDITGVFPAIPRGGISVANWAFLEGRVFITSGPNGICETAAAGDDVQAITVGSGRPNTRAVEAVPAELAPGKLQGDDFLRFSMIMAGPDGIVQSDLEPEYFLPVIPRGFGIPQQRGYRLTDPEADIELGGDDRFSPDARGTRWVMSGPNGILETLPQQGLELYEVGRTTIGVGRGSSGLNIRTYLQRRSLAHWPRETGGDDIAHDNAWISTGPNGICETAALDGEEQAIAIGQGTPDVPVIGPGPDGVLNTQPAGDDTILDETRVFALAGEDFPYLPLVNMWPLEGVPGQQASNPPPGFPNHVILSVGGTLYDPSYGTGPFPDHATWEQASLVAVTTFIADEEGNRIGRGKARREGPLSSTTRLLPPN